MKILTGKVLRLNGRTAVVEISSKRPHPMYGKLIKRDKKYNVDTVIDSLTIGQVVRIIETRPLSKNKNFKVLEDVKKTKSVKSEANKRKK